MTIGSMAAQLAVRLTVISALLATVGVLSYSSTHWDETTTAGTTASSTAPAGR